MLINTTKRKKNKATHYKIVFKIKKALKLPLRLPLIFYFGDNDYDVTLNIIDNNVEVVVAKRK